MRKVEGWIRGKKRWCNEKGGKKRRKRLLVGGLCDPIDLITFEEYVTHTPLERQGGRERRRDGRRVKER